MSLWQRWDRVTVSAPGAAGTSRPHGAPHGRPAREAGRISRDLGGAAEPGLNGSNGGCGARAASAGGVCALRGCCSAGRRSLQRVEWKNKVKSYFNVLLEVS
ncbi:unnamed protein product [Coccothraustes coccothraustes]